MILLDGQAVSKKRLQLLKGKIDKLRDEKRPGLAVVRVGEDPASKVYVGKKIKACQEVGIYSVERHLDSKISQSAVIEIVDQLNADSSVHGILVQLPIPSQLSASQILDRVDPRKDVDGFHPMNLGRLVAGEKGGFVACTPLGIMNLLAEYKIEIAGKLAVVVGRSRIVGRPMSLLLDQAGATVTVVHSKTRDPDSLLERAEILIVAVGKPHLISKQKLKKGVVVVDVGMNRLESGKLVGDVDFERVKEVASAITPVPGGVGPMTICSLLENTWKSFVT